MWVRGLKLMIMMIMANFFVAPYVGAWIETVCAAPYVSFDESHPMWVRGLKLLSYL